MLPRILIATFTLTVVASCQPAVDAPETRRLREDLMVHIYQMTIENGLSPQLKIQVPEGTDSILFEVHGKRGFYYLSKFRTPDLEGAASIRYGEDLVEGGAFSTRHAREVPGFTNWLYPNTPERNADPGVYRMIIRGETAGGDRLTNEEVEVRAYFKAKSNTTTCGLHLDFLVDGLKLGGLPSQETIDQVVSNIDSLYSNSGIGIIDYLTDESKSIATSGMTAGDGLYDASQSILLDARTRGKIRAGSVRVLMGYSLGESLANKAGYSLGLPGPVDPDHPASAVLVGTESFYSANGSINVERLSTTVAHEIGHYLGLYHPSDGRSQLHDPINDTPECNTASCSKEYKENLMTANGSPLRHILTEGQATVIKRHPLCIPMVIATPPKNEACSKPCVAPKTCALLSGQEVCRVACEPGGMACSDSQSCRIDERGTYVCL
jgi:hypothetical protein